MLRSFRPALETLETRQVFAAGPLAGGAVLEPAPRSLLGSPEFWSAQVANGRTETVDINETITIRGNGADPLQAAPVVHHLEHNAAARDALFADFGKSGNESAQIIAILIGMAKSPDSPIEANSSNANDEADTAAALQANEARCGSHAAAVDSAIHRSFLLPYREQDSLYRSTSAPRTFTPSSSQSQIIAVLIGM